MGEMDEIIAEFLIESRENLDRVECGLVELEKDPAATETLASVFRSIHSIKGATGFLGMAKLGAVTHAGESLLSRLRDRTIVFSPAIASVLLALVDAARQLLSSIETTGAEADTDYTSLVERLARAEVQEAAVRPAPDAAAVAEPAAVRPAPAAAAVAEPAAARPAPAAAAVAEPAAARPIAAPEVTLDFPEALAAARSSVRVDVEQLDQLMNLVSELLLIRNEMHEHMSGQDHPGLQGCSHRLAAITTQLQEAVMKTRMQPIENLWNKFPRLVRDSALQCGKTVRLDMEGKDTALDRTLIEAIRDPLTHLLRNGIDHGLEGPEERLQAGKAIEGRLSLRAFHQNGQVVIEVSDDGAGVDLAAVKRTALEHGLITADGARDMSEHDAMDLLFLPGFSTAKQVTSISGRGVGMDVVRTNIAKIGGKVTVSSEPGRGTTLKIRIPLTLATMPALIVSSGGDRYGIPQSHVLELVRLDGGTALTGIQMFRKAAVYRLRGESLPLVRLDAVLGTESLSEDRPVIDADGRPVNIVVLQVDDWKFGLIVDEVDDTQEIVVRPLRNLLKGLPVFAGATVMGDGRAILILDVPGFAVQAHVISEQEGKTAPDRTLAAGVAQEKHPLLLFAGDDEALMAVPLSNVIRLEQFARAAVERSEGRDVVQYMGEIMPLMLVSDLLPERRREQRHPSAAGPADTIQVIVFSSAGHRVGLIVNRILDTIEHTLTELRPSSRRGTMGSVVIQGRVTEILDVAGICAVSTEGAGSKALPEEAPV
jgi:two-component system, chemotaxis family, sensor kinase CheA